MKGKKTLRVIIILLVLVLIAFAGVYAYISLDIFKSPKQLFGKYLENQIMQLQDVNVGALQTVSDRLKTDVSETVLNIKNETDDESTTDLKLGVKIDPNNLKAELKFNLSIYDMKDYADYTLYADKETIALNIPELNEKYFTVGVDSLLDSVEENLKDNKITEKEIDLSKESIKKYKEEIKNLYSKYIEEIKEKLTDDKFVAEKNVSVLVNESNITANRYTLVLTLEEYLNMTTDIFTKILDEPIVSEFMTEEQIEKVRDYVADIKDIAEDDEKDKTIKFSVYESNGNTVKVDIQFDDKVIAEFMLQKISDNESNITFNMNNNEKIYNNDLIKSQNMVYTFNVEDSNTTTVTIKTATSYDKEDLENIKKYYEENDYSSYYIETIEEDYKDSTTTQKMTITLNGDRATNKITTTALDDIGLEGSKVQINYTFGSLVKFSDTSDNIDLDEYKDNEEKQAELISECMTNLQQNPNTLLGSIAMFFGSGFGFDFSEDILAQDDNEDINNAYDEDIDEYALEKAEIEILVRDALNDCLDSYKRDAEEDDGVNVADYLTVPKVSEMMLSSLVSNIEFADGSTIRCNYKGDVYYISLIISAEDLEVTETKAYTESEYQEL